VLRLGGQQMMFEEDELVAENVFDVLTPEAAEAVDRAARELALSRTGADFLDRWEWDHSVSVAELEEHWSSDPSCVLDGETGRTG
jgi:hypothetical protein